MKRGKAILRAAPFMLPSMLGMVIFSFLPIVISIVISLTDWNGLDQLNAQTLRERLCGLENYVTILSSGEFWNVLWHTVYYIILYIPLVLVMSLFIASILNRSMKGINAFQLFPQVQIMTEGGPNGATQVMVERIYTYGFKYFRMGYAAAYSWILFVIIFVLTLVQMKLQKRWVYYES